MSYITLLMLALAVLAWRYSLQYTEKVTGIDASTIDSLAPTREEAELERRDYDPKKDFADLVFGITKYKQAGSQYAFRAEGMLNGKLVGFEVLMQPNIITLRSIGATSDELATEYVRLFDGPQKSAQMIPEIQFTAFTLEGNPNNLMKEPVKFKLFFEKYFEDNESPEAQKFYEEDYFEFYLDLDMPNKRIYLNEKDDSYRTAFLKALLKSSQQDPSASG
ncbi:MAG: hypothetical protein WCJ29_03015 [bacterium]